MYISQTLRDAETQVNDYLGTIRMRCATEEIAHASLVEVMAQRLEDALKEAKSDPRRRARDIFDRLNAYWEFKRKTPLSTYRSAEVLSGAEFAHFEKMVDLYLLELFEVNIHDNTVLSSGTIVTGRIAYDAHVLDNKKKGIFVQMVSA